MCQSEVCWSKFNLDCTDSSCLAAFDVLELRVVMYAIAYVTSHDCAVYIFVSGADVLFSFKLGGCFVTRIKGGILPVSNVWCK